MADQEKIGCLTKNRNQEHIKKSKSIDKHGFVGFALNGSWGSYQQAI